MVPCPRCISPAQCDHWGCSPGTFASEKRDPSPRPLTPEQQAILDAVPALEGRRHTFSGGPAALHNLPRSTASTMPAAAPTTLQLEVIAKLLADAPPEPIGEWMREHGFPPESSLAIMPETMRSQLPFWPRYVRFSTSVAEPVLVKDVLGEFYARYRK